MQVPERLALIGGSILLASTLVFTLKSQASSIIPKVSHSISGVFDHIGDTQKSTDFDSYFQDAQKKGWKTGTWGTAKFYVDNQNNMYVGDGRLSGSYSKVVDADKINTINFERPVQAPQDSTSLLSNGGYANDYLQSINGLSRLDTSQTTNMYNMFCGNSRIRDLDLSHFNTSQVTEMAGIFNSNFALQDLDVSHMDISHVKNMGFMFDNDSSLRTLNLSNVDTSQANNMDYMFYHTNIQKLILGSRTRLANDNMPSDNYTNDGQSLSTTQLSDNNLHPGTWIKQ